jgi:SnoaL-like domain
VTERFADDAVLAYWAGEGEETAPRTIARGAAAISRALASEQRRREVVRELRDGDDAFVEGRLLTARGEVTGSYVASAQFERGAIARCLCFHGPAVEPPSAASEGPPAGAALAKLERYFDRLIAADFDAAAACFTTDCLYSHPPYAPGGPRVEFRGREGLLRGFEQRGPRPVRPAIIRCVQRDADCFIEGVVDPGGGSFVSSAILDGDGLVRRYVAFYTASRVPRRARRDGDQRCRSAGVKST